MLCGSNLVSIGNHVCFQNALQENIKLVKVQEFFFFALQENHEIAAII